MVKYQVLREAKIGEEGSDKEFHLIEFKDKCMEEANEGELLVLRRALSGHKISNREEQRGKIFHTRCTIKDNVCSLVMDGGSCANVASTTLVEKLQLKASPTHIHTPFNGSTKVKASKFLLVIWWLYQLVKVIKMSCGVTSFSWMLVTYHWEGLGSLTIGLCMMLTETPIPY